MINFPSKREIKDQLWAEIIDESWGENIPKTLDEGLIWLENLAEEIYKSQLNRSKSMQAP